MLQQSLNSKNDDTHHWTECECGYAIEKLEHVWGEGEVTVEPGVLPGEKTYTCECTKTETEEIPAVTPEA